jgi:dihydrofolate reductase
MCKIKLIIAIDKNGVMGYENKLPWKLSDDLKNFKSITLGCPIIMGSNTYKSLPGILPNREHIVLSKSLQESTETISVFSDINPLIEYLKEYETAYVIGGADVVNQFFRWNMFDELIITHIDAEVVGDTYIKLPLDNWEIWQETKYVKNTKNEYNFSVNRYVKKKKRFY